MTIAELSEFAAWSNERIAERFPEGNPEQAALAHAVKIGEELGELYEAVLAASLRQRTEKLAAHTQENLAEECADVLISTLVLADEMNVDVQKALHAKMAKIRSRFGPA